MAKTPETPKKPPIKRAKTPAAKPGAGRPEVKPIGPALAELLNPAINRGEAGMGSSTGLQPPPSNSLERRSGGEAAVHRARASTPKNFKGDSGPRPSPLQPFPQPAQPYAPRLSEQGLEEAPQAVYGTHAAIPTLDPELAKQYGFTTEEEDNAALARPPRNKMEALGVQATADALEALVTNGRPEFKDDKIWVPHRPPRPDKSEGGVPFVIKSEYEPKGDQPTAIKELVEGISRNDRTQP